MAFSSMLALLFTHPFEFRTLLQFYLYHEQKRDISATKEHPTSGWDRKSMQRCWQFLDMTSRSFSAVIKELDGDLARTICLFYLVLRGLDTIEDDMTIPDDVKQPILRSFHEKTVTPGWKYDGCGPNEKDRQLLVEYDVVVEEMNRLDPKYKEVILDICQKMETGMADFAHSAATTSSIYLPTVADYDLYCHYVAGLVGEGLSRLFSASEKEMPLLGDQLGLSSSMGLLLQKTNIIRDYREDVEEHRYFWPKEIWGRPEYGFSEMKDMCTGWDAKEIPGEPSVKQRALWVQSGMVVDALRHAVDALDYLRLLKTQSVFNFAAIPATMAMATLSLCFMNPEMFQKNIKIRKAEAASLIMRSTNPREVAYIFREYSRKIHARVHYSDPNFLRVSVACSKIEQWCEHSYPSFVQVDGSRSAGLSSNIDPTDARSRVVELGAKFDSELRLRRRTQEIRAGLAAEAANGNAPAPPAGETEGVPWDLIAYAMAVFIGILLFVFAGIWFMIKMLGEEGELSPGRTHK